MVLPTILSSIVIIYEVTTYYLLGLWVSNFGKPQEAALKHTLLGPKPKVPDQ